MAKALDTMRKGNALAAIDQLSRALAFPETGAVGYRLATLQLLAPERDRLVAFLREERQATGHELTGGQIFDLILKEIGR